MNYSKNDIKLTNQWVDITTLVDYDDLIDVQITIYAKYVNGCLIFVGGTSAPTDNSGILLVTGKDLKVLASNIWVKGTGSISVLVE